MREGFFEKLLARLDRLSPTELESVVERLVRDRGFLEQVFEALREGVMVMTPEGELTFLNSAACALFGLRREGALGIHLEGLIQGLEWSELAGKGVLRRDLEVRYPERRLLNLHFAPIEEEVRGEQEVLGYVLLVRDVTESRRVAEEELESEKLNALTLLAAGVAHEIGNPLNSIGIHLQLMEREVRELPGGAQRRLKRSLELAREEIHRLDALLKGFLHAIRPQSVRLEETDLHDLLDETLEILAPELGSRRVRVKLDLAEGMPRIALDAAQIKQAFYNVIRNAAQALPASGGDLEIRTEVGEYEVVVEVVDHGVGMSAEVMGSLFEPFHSHKPGGTGLGLLIVRRIVREHGGEIEVESTEGEGTRVRLFFPCQEDQVRLLEDHQGVIEI